MRYIFILIIFCANLLAVDVIKGTVFMQVLEKSSSQSKLFIDDQEIELLPHPHIKHQKVALIPIPYKTKKKQIELLHVDGKNREKILLHVKDGGYKKEILKVSKKKVKPPKTELDRIYTEYKEAKKIYATNTPKRYWTQPFIYPLDSKITSHYGNARISNGSLKSFHSGTDFRAAVGTPIKAVNDGVVVIAKDRYYAGGSVVIDHGEGIYSTYYHLSQIDVKVGEKIRQNEHLGLSGATGRVTGPHLHFSIMYKTHAINPLDFIDKINSLF